MLIGNLGADPEVRSTANGARVATLSVATSRQWNNQAGERQEKTQWHRVVLWNNNKGSGLADFAEKYLKKGDRVYVEGEIEYRTWEDRDGKTRYTTEIKAFQVMSVGGKGGGGGAGDSGEPMKSRAVQPAVAEAKSESFDDFPEALDEEDDDLPF
jgi:single-strand DNA-binding protein